MDHRSRRPIKYKYLHLKFTNKVHVHSKIPIQTSNISIELERFERALFVYECALLFGNVYWFFGDFVFALQITFT